MNLEEAVIEMGFLSEADFHNLVSSRDISTPEKFRAFRNWQDNDGTRAGLLNLPKRANKQDERTT